MGASSKWEKVRVAVRIRPRLGLEAGHSTNFMKVSTQHSTVEINPPDTSSSYSQLKNTVLAKEYKFDNVFDATATQETIFSDLGIPKMIEAALGGYHATVFAYGQTGSGKTYSMEGYEYSVDNVANDKGRPRVNTETRVGQLGIIPRAVDSLFLMIQQLKQQWCIKCSFVQIYNEKIFDLLNPSHLRQKVNEKTGRQGLRLRWKASNEFYVENLFMVQCRSRNEVLNNFHAGLKHKIMASHQMNAASSRSHSVFTIYVDGAIEDKNSGTQTTTGRLTLVDLAGSERVSKTGATGQLLAESIGINKSLSVLRNVIHALVDKKSRHIPYRDSKLTSILKHSLGGNSMTLMIACLSPSNQHLEENISTLMYASCAAHISNKPQKNEDPKNRVIRQLQNEVRSLKDQLLQAQTLVMSFQGMPRKAENEAFLSLKKEADVSVDFQNAVPDKLGVIESATIMKNLYKNEQQLRQRLDEKQSKEIQLISQNRELCDENQMLRERIEVLEYLVATSEKGSCATNVVSIPGYGDCTMDTLPSFLCPPSKSRIHKVLRDVKSDTEKKIESNQKEATKEKTKVKAKPRRKTPGSNASKVEAGSLSVNDLQKLLHSRKFTGSKEEFQGADIGDTTTSRDPLQNVLQLSKLLRNRAQKRSMNG